MVEIPEDLTLQETPSDDVKTVPLAPTLTNKDPDHATAASALEVPEACEVHMMPSGEVKIVPEAPTATNSEPVQVTPASDCVPVGELCADQETPVKLTFKIVLP